MRPVPSLSFGLMSSSPLPVGLNFRIRIYKRVAGLDCGGEAGVKLE
jgi:hypothetical protein